MDAIGRARAWAAEVLGAVWTPERFGLEVEREEVRFLRRAGHHVVTVRFAVWERLGVAAVALTPGGPRARFPVSSEDGPAADPRAIRCDPGAPELAAAIAAARGAADPAGRRAVRARACWAVPSRGGLELLVLLEHRPDDGLLAVDLDARDGERLGYRCLPFRRGSRRSAALSRFSAVKRARAALTLPAAARLVRCELVHGAGARLWRLRWEVGEGPGRGFVAAALNGRSGQVCETFAARRPALTAAALPSREEARRTLELAVRARLGRGAYLGPLVAGASGPADERVWLAVARGPGGGLFRASVSAGARVSLSRLDDRRSA